MNFLFNKPNRLRLAGCAASGVLTYDTMKTYTATAIDRHTGKPETTTIRAASWPDAIQQFTRNKRPATRLVRMVRN